MVLKSRKFKRILVIGIIAVMVFAMAACKETEEPPVEESSSEPASSSEAAPTPTKGAVSYEDMMKKLDEAKEINELVAGWLTVPGTNIDEAVIVDNDHDNGYWIDRNLEGEQVPSGYTEWEDTVTYAHCFTNITEDLTFSSSNYVLFGHNWNNIREPLVIGDDGTDEYTMFAQLPSFTDIDFASEYQHMYFSTPENEMVWRVFSVMYTEEEWPDLDVEYWSPNPTKAQRVTLVNELIDRSIFIYDVDVDENDILLTLSTCTRVYPDVGEEQRYVVVARMLREGESDSDTVKVTENLSVKEPSWD